VSQDLVDMQERSFASDTVIIQLPKVSRRTYSGVVRANAGETLVIGGLLSDRESNKKTGIPFLSRIPILGVLFGAHDYQKIRSELVVTITPRASKK
jgi:general secretion pathway protein D